MGHIRLGRLPRTLRWQGVVQLLDQSPEDVSAVTRATLTTASERLRQLTRDPWLSFCFWLLARVTEAARGPEFVSVLAELGIEAQEGQSTIGFISRVSDRAREEAARHPESGPFAELASLALRRALSETVGQEGRPFLSTALKDLQHPVPRGDSPMAPCS
jgi:hypothetical protein